MNTYSDLIKENPQNAAFYIYKAIVEKDLGKNELARKTIQNMENSSQYYDSYESSWAREIRKLSLSSPPEFIRGEGMLSIVASPNVTKIRKFSKDMGLDLEKLGKFMVEDGIKADGDISSRKWNSSQYMIGYDLVNPDPSKIRWHIPTFAELSERGRKNFDATDETSFINGIKSMQECNRNAYEDWLNNYRIFMLNKLKD